MISDNLISVRQNIERSAQKAGRKPQDITLVCVTKEADVEEIRQAIAFGVSDIGENRVQDAVEKFSIIGQRARWHLIGHLQTNKVKKAVEIFDLIHSVDSFHLTESVSKEAAKINKIQDILIQVNASGEQSKFGVNPHETISLLRKIISLNNIRVLGFMTMAPLTGDRENIRFCFRKLKQLSEEARDMLIMTYKLQFIALSMGMSNDYQVAIEEGATMVRIGSAIFK